MSKLSCGLFSLTQLPTLSETGNE